MGKWNQPCSRIEDWMALSLGIEGNGVPPNGSEEHPDNQALVVISCPEAFMDIL